MIFNKATKVVHKISELELEAIQLFSEYDNGSLDERINQAAEFMGFKDADLWDRFAEIGSGIDLADGRFKINTFSGAIEMKCGDWMLKDYHGYSSRYGIFYHCSSDMFFKTYFG